MKYLLDTNTCIFFLNGTEPTVTRRILEVGPAGLALSCLSVAELRFGAARSAKRQSNNARIDRFTAEMATIPFDNDCARHFGRIKAEQLEAGRPIPDFDAAIAATAAAMGMVVVSTDHHMADISGIEVEDWLRR